MRILELPRSETRALAFTPDGRWLAVMNFKAIGFWDLTGDRESRSAWCGGPCASALHFGFCADGRHLLLSPLVYDVSHVIKSGPWPRGRLRLARVEIPSVGSWYRAQVRFAHGRTAVAFPYGKEVGFWQFRDQTLTTQPGPPRTKQPAWSRGLHSLSDVTDDGRVVSVIDGPDVRLWDARTGAWAARLTQPDRYAHMTTFSPDGRWVVAATGPRSYPTPITRTVRVWDVASGEPVATFDAGMMQAVPLAWHPSGTWLGAAGEDGSVRLWEVGTWRETVRFDWKLGPLRAVAFSPDGLTAATAGKGRRAVLWDLG